MIRQKQTKINKIQLALNILIFVFWVLLIFSLIYIAKWFLDNETNKEITKQVSQIAIYNVEKKEAKSKVDFEKLKKINNEIVGYLKVNGTKIDYPVVQAKDNSYYLKRNLDKKYNISGWIFMDYKNKLDGTDKNIVIYGHNVKDGSMFGTLKNILNDDWYNNSQNHIIDFITEKGEQKYQVFSIYKIKTEDYYINTEFVGEEFTYFIQILKDRSIKDFDVSISKEDSILTLSTCADNYNYRIVLHAKKL